MNWAGSAFVWTYGNVPLTGLPPWITRLFVQLCSGLEPSEQRPDHSWVARALDAGYDVAAWHWCTGENPEAEAVYHALMTRSYGIQILVANLEEPYDAHGDSTNAKYHLPARYLAALAWDGPLGVTTTPRFASDMTAWRNVGAITMPQSFPTAAEGGHDLPTVVQHAEDWGWDREQIRPLVQTYEGAGGKRPNAQEQNHQAAELDVGVTPYTVEQSIGSPALDHLKNAIERVTPGQQKPPEPPPDTGDPIMLIGPQDGVVAEYNRLRDLDPGGTLLVKGPDGKWPSLKTLTVPLDQWKAWDKAQRRQQILVDDHDQKG